MKCSVKSNRRLDVRTLGGRIEEGATDRFWIQCHIQLDGVRKLAEASLRLLKAATADFCEPDLIRGIDRSRIPLFNPRCKKADADQTFGNGTRAMRTASLRVTQ